MIYAARIFSFLYPVFIFLILTYSGLRSAALFLAASGLIILFILRLSPGNENASSSPIQSLMALGMIILGVVAWLFDSDKSLRFYPVFVNILLFAFFSGSLFAEQTIIERLARIRRPDLPPKAVIYTRNVTRSWCAFFVLNGGMAFYTAQYGTLSLWTLYNGFIAYLLMGIMFAGEFLIRTYVMRGNNETP